MMFCQGDAALTNRVMEALIHFSSVSSHKSNLPKLNMFFVSIDEIAKQGILAQNIFTLGFLPIKYLSLPLSSKRWNKVDCF